MNTAALRDEVRQVSSPRTGPRCGNAAERSNSDDTQPLPERRLQRRRSCTDTLRRVAASVPAGAARVDACDKSIDTDVSTDNIRKLPFSTTPTRQNSARWQAIPDSKRHPIRRCHSADDHMKQLKERRDSALGVIQHAGTPVVPKLVEEGNRSSSSPSTDIADVELPALTSAPPPRRRTSSGSRLSSTQGSMYTDTDYESDDSDDSSIATTDILDILNHEPASCDLPMTALQLQYSQQSQQYSQQSPPRQTQQNPIEQQFMIDLSGIPSMALPVPSSPQRPPIPITPVTTPRATQITAAAAPVDCGWMCACGEENESEFVYCGLCGVPRHPPRWSCTHCSFSRNKSGRTFCGVCGVQQKPAPSQGVVTPKAA